MFIERTNYFVKPQQHDAMLAARRQASHVRVELGLNRGHIWCRKDPADPGPDVVWECRFRSLDEQRRDLAIRDGSPAFEAVRAWVGELVERFERHVLRLDDGDPDHRTSDVDLTAPPIVPHRLTVPSAGRYLAGFLYLPPGDGPYPCMITNHGGTIHQGTTDQCRPGTAAPLMSWGIASLLVHHRGYGDSPGPAWEAEVPEPFGSDDYD
ncbi:MAG: hypothetical protein VCB77_04720 [Alphaproteobacteria bacterium]